MATPHFDLSNRGYNGMITHLRELFFHPMHDLNRISISLNNKDLTLGFRPADHYLCEIEGTLLREENLHYSSMPVPHSLGYSEIMDCANIDPENMSERNRRRLRILCFITAESARFPVFSRNCSSILNAQPGSAEAEKSVINFQIADRVMTSYGAARKLMGLGPKQFCPVPDHYAHAAAYDKIPITHNLDMAVNPGRPRMG